MSELNDPNSILILFYMLFVLDIINSIMLSHYLYKLKFPLWNRIKSKLKNKYLIKSFFTISFFILLSYLNFLSNRETMLTTSYISISIYMLLSTYALYSKFKKANIKPIEILLFKYPFLREIVYIVLGLIFGALPPAMVLLVINS